MSKNKGWPGIVPLARRFIWGASEPKATMPESGSQTARDNYSGMDENYKWFRKDRLVKRCILVNSYFSTLSAGFDTKLQVTDKSLAQPAQKAVLEKHKDVKVFIDELNKHLKMDQVLFITQIKRSIFGRCGWEIIMDNEGDAGKYPNWLLSLRSEKLKPKQNKKTWELKGFTYGNMRVLKYKPEDIFYITNLQLEHDYMGISEIEPIRPFCEARNDIVWENFPEIVKTLWAPYTILSADTSMMSTANETTFLNNLGQMARAGKSLAVNKSIEATAVAMKADIMGLSKILDDAKEEITGNFGTPRFLLGQPIENRATAYAELEAYVDGPIAGIQKELKRVMEAWYDRWVRVYLKEDAASKIQPDDDGILPVEVKHVWNTIRTSDLVEQANAAAALWGPGGMGPLGLNPEVGMKKVWEMMDWDPAELEEEEGAE